MTKHEYRAKYRGFQILFDREQATYWWQRDGGYQSLTKACKAIDEFKGEDRAPVRNYTGGDTTAPSELSGVPANDARGSLSGVGEGPQET